jgi:phage terminase small subunit
MATLDDLKKLDSTYLAVLCKKVSEFDNIDEQSREQALSLRDEWVGLILKQTPPPMTAREYDAIQLLLEQVKERMARFLVPYA